MNTSYEEGRQAWEEGYGAFLEGANEEDNPFRKGTDLALEWLDGWDAASLEEDWMEG